MIYLENQTDKQAIELYNPLEIR